MSELSFLPWYCIIEPEKIGSYTLEPYEQGILNLNLASNASMIEAVLSSYLVRPFTMTDAASKHGREMRVKDATIITSSTGCISEIDFDPLQYIVSFCGISNRNFRNELYLCSENLRIVTQKHPNPISIPFDPSVGTRRKNGSSVIAFSPGLFREVKPWHVANQQISGNRDYRIKFDGDLARCLWSLFKGKGEMRSAWELNVFPALFSYYSANTDGASKQTECAYSQAAIERLFLGASHSEDSLISAILDFFTRKGIVFETFPTSTRNWKAVTFKQNQIDVPSRTIFEAWLRELTRLRNRFAHGNYAISGNWVWTLEEHLVLASFIFPLLLKAYLTGFHSRVTYVIPSENTKQIRMLERLLAETNYFAETYQHSGRTRWGQVLYDAFWLT